MTDIKYDLETELQMLNHIKQLLGDMILKQRQMERMSADMNHIPKTLGRPRLPPKTPEEKREKHNDYHKNYYHASTLSNVIVCEICHKNTTVQKIKRHQRSVWCDKYKLFHNDC